MSAINSPALDRRQFLKLGGMLGGGLIVGLQLPAQVLAAQPEASLTDLGAFIRIGHDNQVTLVMPMAEVGQGVYMAQSMLLAEELEVAVSEQGAVRCQRIHAVIDCGLTVNPDTVKAQIEGGAVFGLTAALYGAITVKNGQVQQSNFDTYQPVRMYEAPHVDVHIVDSLEAPGGVGETGTAAVFPAITNAVFAATGKRIRTLPINPSELKV